MPTRLQLRGDTMEGLQARVLNQYPAGSEIVEAAKVSTGGLFGVGARVHYEAIVEVPDNVIVPSFTASQRNPGSHPVPARAGVAALLADADKAETAMHAPATARTPEVSTSTRSFDELIESLDRSTLAKDSQGAAAQGPGGLLTGPGDVILVAGLGADALTAVRTMAAAVGSSTMVTAGSFRAHGTDHIVSRQGLLTAQASAVIAHEPVLVAFGLGTDGSLRTNALTELKADQVWAVVDATRKHDDTETWVKKVSWSAPIQFLAVINSQDTKTPETVNELGIPIGWIDGRKAGRSAL